MIDLLFAVAATAATPVSTPCKTLLSDYEQVQKAMASRWADSIGDNSAPRATLSEMKDNNDLLRAQMTLELLRAKSCPLPNRAPSLSRYLTPALDCANARSAASLARKDASKLAECEMSNWQPSSQ